jgi:hypothetical protein
VTLDALVFTLLGLLAGVGFFALVVAALEHLAAKRGEKDNG